MYGKIAGLICLLSTLYFAMEPVRADADACNLQSTGINFFQPYDFLSGTAETAIGTIGYTCTGEDKNAQVDIDVNGGNSGNPLSRYMLNGSARLYYNLYYLGNPAWIWGDGTQGVQYQKIMTPDAEGSFSDSATFMAAIPPGQNTGAGAYRDTLVVTITIEH